MRKSLLIVPLVLVLVLLSHKTLLAADLGISPVTQRTPVWCWVAVGEMIFEHYSVPNINPGGVYQCGIIGGLVPPFHPCNMNCLQCTVPAGSMQAVQDMLRRYPMIAAQVHRDPSIRMLSSDRRSRELFEDEIRTEIDEDRPIIAGINPTGFPFPGVSQHVALIVGYSEDDDGDLVLSVNDPFPFDLVDFSGRQNPYRSAGGTVFGNGNYEVEYDVFRRALRWNTTIYKIGPR